MDAMKEQLLMKLLDAFTQMDDGSEEKSEGLEGHEGLEAEGNGGEVPAADADAADDAAELGQAPKAPGLEVVIGAGKKKPGLF